MASDPRRDAASAGRVDGGTVALVRGLLVHRHGSAGDWTWAAIGWVRERRASAKDVAVGKERRAARRDTVVSEQKRVAARAPPRIEPPTPSVEKSERVEKERQVPLFDPPKAGELPPLSLLDDPPAREPLYSAEALEALSRLVEMKLKDFDIEAEVVAVQPGPVVTRFELRPAPGVKASQITSLSKDLARALSVLSVRVVEVIPGKSVMGLEIANEKREIVTLGEIIRSKAYDEMHSPIALALGKDIGGQPYVADLARMPHLLIAGTTGSGKSVAINAMVLSLLYKSTAEHVRLIMIDPKMLELSVYEGIPHLLAPVVTDMKQAANALRWCVAEMERRYQLMAALGVRNIAGFNRRVKDANDAGKPILDPVMLQRAANDPTIDQREIQPRAAAVHRRRHRRARRPHDDRRQEGRGADRAPGAEGARIRHPPGAGDAAAVGGCDHRSHQSQHSMPHRLPGVRQGGFAHDSRPDGGRDAARPRRHALPAVGHLVADTRAWRVRVGSGSPPGRRWAEDRDAARLYRGGALRARGPIPGLPGEEGEAGAAVEDPEQDALYDEAVRIVITERKPSISYVQRRLKIGYNRAARLLEAMETAGLVGPLQSNGSREVLAPAPAED